MKKILSLCLFASTTLSWADVIKSPIHSVERVNETYVVKFENGRVGFMSAAEKSLGAQVHAANYKDGMVEAKLDDQYNIISIQTIQDKSSAMKGLSFTENVEPPVFEPTIIEGMATATTIFNRLNPNYKRASECTNRAHVWSHEEFTKNGLKSQKAFLFFTATYITRNKSKWWFHVAPMFQVREKGKVEGRVMDYMFDRGPRTYTEWKDNFVFSKRVCKDLVNFSDYDLRADQTEDCYSKIGTMYDWNPIDFRNQERGIYKTEFSMGEVRSAYTEAF